MQNDTVKAKANFYNTRYWARALYRRGEEAHALSSAQYYFLNLYGNLPDSIELFIVFAASVFMESSSQPKNVRDVNVWLKVLRLGYFDFAFKALSPWVNLAFQEKDPRFLQNALAMLGRVLASFLAVAEKTSELTEKARIVTAVKPWVIQFQEKGDGAQTKKVIDRFNKIYDKDKRHPAEIDSDDESDEDWIDDSKEIKESEAFDSLTTSLGSWAPMDS
tara:strand:- start:3315 stop:3971 length:657 start_codon:yes stop_codon:yes gene_type:complete